MNGYGEMFRCRYCGRELEVDKFIKARLKFEPSKKRFCEDCFKKLKAAKGIFK